MGRLHGDAPAAPRNSPRHFEALLQRLAPSIPDMDTVALATLMWACGKMRVQPAAGTARAWAAAAWELRESFTPLEITNCMFA